MNVYDLWRLREFGLAGAEVQMQNSNFWSKRNCAVVRHPIEKEKLDKNSNTTAKKESRIVAYVRRNINDGAPLTSSDEPPAKKRKVKLRTPRSKKRPNLNDARDNLFADLSDGSVDDLLFNHDEYSYPPFRQHSEAVYKGDPFVSGGDRMRELCSSIFPQLARERHIDLGQYNKVFAARWLADDRIVMGTKCNSILIMDANEGRRARRAAAIKNQAFEDEDFGLRRARSSTATALTKITPLKSSEESNRIEPNCGIHAIDVNPSGTLLACGGENPADISVFRLPNFEPLTVGEAAHEDWLFDLQWLDDEFLVSGSRDSSLALWRFRDEQEDMFVCPHTRLVRTCDNASTRGGYIGASHCCSSSSASFNGRCMSYPTSRPVQVRKLERFDKVRALTFNQRRRALTSVSLNSYLHVLDINTFKQINLSCIEGYTECVCLCNSPDESLLTIGSRTSFAFYDTRSWGRVWDERLPRRMEDDSYVQAMMPSGVRSVSWRGNLLTLGTGGGDIIFYDVRAKKFLMCDCNRSLTLKITGGWLRQDEVFQEIFLSLPSPNAVYAHCYDEYGTRLFATGGPIASSLVGNYAAMWQ